MKAFCREKKMCLQITNLKLIVILLSNVFCKLLFLLLSLPPLLGTFLFLVGIWGKTKCTNCLVMHIEAESNPWIECKLRFVRRVDVSCLLWHHPAICMIHCCINRTISDCLGNNTLSISNRIGRVQSQLLGNISKWDARIRDADVPQPSPNDIMPQPYNQVIGSVRAESTWELLSNWLK